MPRPQRADRDPEIEAEFVEADLRAVDALLDLAEDESLFGTREGALRVLEQAEEACADGERRLHALGHAQVRRFGPRLAKVQDAIAGMKPRLK